jgi:hypothetical protein
MRPFILFFSRIKTQIDFTTLLENDCDVLYLTLSAYILPRHFYAEKGAERDQMEEIVIVSVSLFIFKILFDSLSCVVGFFELFYVFNSISQHFKMSHFCSKLFTVPSSSNLSKVCMYFEYLSIRL